MLHENEKKRFKEKLKTKVDDLKKENFKIERLPNLMQENGTKPAIKFSIKVLLLLIS